MRKPIVITDENREILAKAAQAQELKTSYSNVLDPKFKRWSYEPNERYLMYVPNLVELDEAGNKVIRPYVLPIEEAQVVAISAGNRFPRYRTTQGLSIGIPGISGECPLMKGINLSWDLFRVHQSITAAEQGIESISDLSADAKTKLNSQVFQKYPKVFDNAEAYVALPLVHIHTRRDASGGFTISPVVEDGRMKFDIYWYVGKKSTFDKMFSSILDTLKLENAEHISIAGRFYTFNYVTTDKNAANLKRSAGRDMRVLSATVSESVAKLGPKLDVQAFDMGYRLGNAAAALPEFAYYTDEDMAEEIKPFIAKVETELVSANQKLDLVTAGKLAGAAATFTDGPAGSVASEDELQIEMSELSII